MERPQQQISAKKVVVDDDDPNFERKLEVVHGGASLRKGTPLKQNHPG